MRMENCKKDFSAMVTGRAGFTIIKDNSSASTDKKIRTSRTQSLEIVILVIYDRGELFTLN